MGCKHTFHPSAETDIYTYLPGTLCQTLCWKLVTDKQATQGLLPRLPPGDILPLTQAGSLTSPSPERVWEPLYLLPP